MRPKLRRFLTLPPVGLSPTEHICLFWTHSGAKTRSRELRGLAVIELEQPAEALTTCDRPCSDHRCRGGDEFVAQTLVRTFFMIMMHERPHRSSEVRFAQEHHALQARDLADSTNLSANAFKLGLHAGRTT